MEKTRLVRSVRHRLGITPLAHIEKAPWIEFHDTSNRRQDHRHADCVSVKKILSNCTADVNLLSYHLKCRNFTFIDRAHKARSIYLDFDWMRPANDIPIKLDETTKMLRYYCSILL